MNRFMQKLRCFRRKEDGVITVEFLLYFPFMIMFLLAVLEGGMVNTRQVMLERGIDLTIRDVRIGAIKDPTHAQLKKKVCDYAAILVDCEENLQLEMIPMDVRNWSSALNGPVRCIDRGLTVQPTVSYTNGQNNELLVMQVCVLFKPFAPSSPAQCSIVSNGLQERHPGYPALVANSAFVMEPFQ